MYCKPWSYVQLGALSWGKCLIRIYDLHFAMDTLKHTERKGRGGQLSHLPFRKLSSYVLFVTHCPHFLVFSLKSLAFSANKAKIGPVGNF